MSTGDRKAYMASKLAERGPVRNVRSEFMRDGFDYASLRMGQFAQPRKLERGELLDIRKHRPALEMPEEIVNPYQAEAVETMEGMGVHMKKSRARAPKSSVKYPPAGTVHDFGMGRPSAPAVVPRPSPQTRMVGAAKPPNRWMEHVKNYAAKHGVSFKEAMSAAKSTYRK